MSYAEAMTWAHYRAARGPLDLGMRLEVVAGQIMAMVAGGHPTAYMPHVQAPQLTPEQVMGQLARVAPTK